MLNLAGVHVTKSLREHFGSSFIVNGVVCPYSSGEVIVQNYNTVLTVAHLDDVGPTEGCILILIDLTRNTPKYPSPHSPIRSQMV